MGTGLLKPNISSLLGSLYSENDTRRDGGFTLFYVGINFGMLLATCLAGYLVEYLNWHNTFATASAGLVLGSVIFYWGTQHYAIHNKAPQPSNQKSLFAYAAIVAVTAFNAFIIQHENFALACFLFVCAATVFIVIFKALQFQSEVRNRILAYFILVIVSVMFWAFYFQVFFSLNLFVLRVVDHKLLDFNVPTPVFMGIESFGVIVFGLILGKAWTWLKNKSYGPSTAMKFTLGMMFISLAFGVLFLSLSITEKSGMVPSNWLILAYLIIALAELAISPIGLAMVTEFVPQSLQGLMMGIWFVSTGIGGKLAGLFADDSAIPDNLHQLKGIEQIYHHAFFSYFLITLAASLIVLMLNPLLKRLTANKATAQSEKLQGSCCSF
jgi:POT family proton-dependent oligopeptide transporter